MIWPVGRKKAATMSRPGIKTITDWFYVHGKIRIRIPVTMIDASWHKPHRLPEEQRSQQVKTYFRVKMEDPEIQEEDINIDALQKRVMAIIKDKLTIEWKSMLHVTVSGDRKKLQEPKTKDPNATVDTASVNLHIKWERVQISEYKGKKYYRTFHSADRHYNMTTHTHEGPYVVKWSGPIDGWPETGSKAKERGRWQTEKEMSALIEDTPENRAALEVIAAKTEELHERMMQLLSPKSIVQALQAISYNPQLLLENKKGPGNAPDPVEKGVRSSKKPPAAAPPGP